MIHEKQELSKVRDFMLAYDQTVRSQPVDALPVHEKFLRLNLILEEVKELGHALGVEIHVAPLVSNDKQSVDAVAALDALTDILYVVFGTYHTLGLGKCAKHAFDEVHESNMSKLGPDNRPVKNDFGKVMKGPNYYPPDLITIVEAARRVDSTIFDDVQ